MYQTPQKPGYLKQLKKKGQTGLAETEALAICIAAANGLAAAHAKGIIHRDIKPDNILVPPAAGGNILDFAGAKVADLGLARQQEGGQSLTGTSSAMGTPGFMPPEQGMSARKAGKPADVFALGATLYALLAGKPPFTGDTAMAIMIATLQKCRRIISRSNVTCCGGTERRYCFDRLFSISRSTSMPSTRRSLFSRRTA
ncbi:MAG: protein kinase [Planctomycetota bacterium]|nr:protein kinase [Planctomycetota bacterium]